MALKAEPRWHTPNRRNSPIQPDTDHDGLLDGLEDFNRNGKRDLDETDPLNPDSDGDGLDDGLEDLNLNGIWDDGETAAYRADSDNGGENDGAEVLADRNPLNPRDDRVVPPLDTDDDGLPDAAEDTNLNGRTDEDETDSRVADTDNDGVEDGLEANSNQQIRKTQTLTVMESTI